MSAQEKLLDQCRLIFATADDKLRRLLSDHPNYFPMYTREGKWKHDGALWTNWCEGFLPGQL